MMLYLLSVALIEKGETQVNPIAVFRTIELAKQHASIVSDKKIKWSVDLRRGWIGFTGYGVDDVELVIEEIDFFDE